MFKILINDPNAVKSESVVDVNTSNLWEAEKALTGYPVGSELVLVLARRESAGVEEQGPRIHKVQPGLAEK